MEEQKKTLEYQETMNLDIENIASTSQNICRSIYEVTNDDYFEAVEFFPTEILNQCKKIKISLRTYQTNLNQI